MQGNIKVAVLNLTAITLVYLWTFYSLFIGVVKYDTAYTIQNLEERKNGLNVATMSSKFMNQSCL